MAQTNFGLDPEHLSLALKDVEKTFAQMDQAQFKLTQQNLFELLPPATTAILSDLLVSALERNAEGLVRNRYPNGHPDLLPKGLFPNNAAQSAPQGIEVKVTKNSRAAVDMHGARKQTLLVAVYSAQESVQFQKAYLGAVTLTDFRKNARGELGTRTASLNAIGLAKLRSNPVY